MFDLNKIASGTPAYLFLSASQSLIPATSLWNIVAYIVA